jgi:hypothetical protein
VCPCVCDIESSPDKAASAFLPPGIDWPQSELIRASVTQHTDHIRSHRVVPAPKNRLRLLGVSSLVAVVAC